MNIPLPVLTLAVASAILCLNLTSCATGSQLRVTNAGKNEIRNLTVLFPESEIHFGDVPGGATTGYKIAAKGVYNYGAYRYTVGGEQVTQPVIDWMGERPREGRRFTYVLELDPARPALQRVRLVEMVREE